MKLLGLHVAKVSEFHLLAVHKVNDGLDGGLVTGQDLALLLCHEGLYVLDLLTRPQKHLRVVCGGFNGLLEDIGEDGT